MPIFELPLDEYDFSGYESQNFSLGHFMLVYYHLLGASYHNCISQCTYNEEALLEYCCCCMKWRKKGAAQLGRRKERTATGSTEGLLLKDIEVVDRGSTTLC
jgi:hypothetical protein